MVNAVFFLLQHAAFPWVERVDRADVDGAFGKISVCKETTVQAGMEAGRWRAVEWGSGRWGSGRAVRGRARPRRDGGRAAGQEGP